MKDNSGILLIEDDDVDAKTIQRALKELHVTNPVTRVINAEEGLERLRDTSQMKPGLILLDLNLPGMNGLEFLKLIKEDESLRRMPVIVLTSSKLECDKLTSFDLSVAGYMVKPVDYVQFVEVVRAINLYWTLSETP